MKNRGNAFDTQRKRDNQERVAFVKAKVGFDDVVTALDCETEGPECPNPHCGARTLKACHGGRGFYCDTCSDTGDVITLVRASKNCGHLDALDFLEEILPARAERCAGTGDLFKRGRR